MTKEPKIIFVGLCPTQETHVKRPTIGNGPAQKLLTKLLVDAGYNLGEVKVVNAIDLVTKVGHNVTKESISNAAVANDHLYQKIKDCKVIATLGTEASRAVMLAVDTWAPACDKIFIALPHPSGISRLLRDPQEALNVTNMFRAMRNHQDELSKLTNTKG